MKILILLLVTISFSINAQPLDKELSKKYESTIKEEQVLREKIQRAIRWIKSGKLEPKLEKKAKYFVSVKIKEYYKKQDERKAIADKLIIFP